MSTDKSHANRLREIAFVLRASDTARFGTAYEAALVAGFYVLTTNERETDMATTTDNATHARHIRQALDDVRAGRAINTSGEVQSALEAAATQLEAGGTDRRLDTDAADRPIDLPAAESPAPAPAADVPHRTPRQK